ncbi:MAG: hypothetical protein RMJ56_13970 [Gemmataceae bacterium]|nr:hypothetical protein [Gemmata sp.]MDW8198699.1 hypothetical protein [Gemmataceae bacterium]
MADVELLSYLLNLVEEPERAAIAQRLHQDRDLAQRYEQLRRASLVTALEQERDHSPQPPPGLAIRAIERVARHIVEHEPRPPQPPTRDPRWASLLLEPVDEPHTTHCPAAAPLPSAVLTDSTETARGVASPIVPMPAPPPTDRPDYRSSGRFRADALVAACIALISLGLVVSGITKARYQQRLSHCQNSLHTLHRGLNSYADSDPHGRYPQVGTEQLPTADRFATVLVDLGHLPVGYQPGCPAAADVPPYTYTLGFRGPQNQILGLRRPGHNADSPQDNTMMPIAADLPSFVTATDGQAVSPHGRIMNVLFIGGNVRVTTSPHVGPRGDDIYHNAFGHVAAGVHATDAVLGGRGDRP